MFPYIVQAVKLVIPDVEEDLLGSDYCESHLLTLLPDARIVRGNIERVSGHLRYKDSEKLNYEVSKYLLRIPYKKQSEQYESMIAEIYCRQLSEFERQLEAISFSLAIELC
ncbi:Hypothetical predicted protein [Octopus vulgaris]|uniref:Uncharacterized protein n=1 Tax=Octopus vulgaris TaxID=6645 RepID=A0AA36BM05_OCTVU|nr:Hypothetical predicted protein [Octopus vulgaris]